MVSMVSDVPITSTAKFAIQGVRNGFRIGIVFSEGVIAFLNDVVQSTAYVNAGNQVEHQERSQDDQNDTEGFSTFHGETSFRNRSR